MNVIMKYPSETIAEIMQARRDLTAHQHEIELSLDQFVPCHLTWKIRDREIQNRLDAIRSRLLALYA